MADLGLTTRPNRRADGPRPVNVKKWPDILCDPYYAGFVRYAGEQYPGRHEPLISQDLFEAAERVIAARSKGGSRDRVHHMYLRGTIFCNRCYGNGHLSRLVFTPVSGRSGKYRYFVCTGRANYGCTLPHLQIPLVERAVEDFYEQLRPLDNFVDTIRTELASAVSDSQRATFELEKAATKRLAEIAHQQERLLDALGDGSLPHDAISARVRKLQIEKDRLHTDRTDATKRLAVGANALDVASQMVTDPQRTYQSAPDDARREMNAAFFTRLFIDEHGDVAHGELTPAIGSIVDAYRDHDAEGRPGHSTEASITSAIGPNSVLRTMFDVRGSNKATLVELPGSLVRQRLCGAARVHGIAVVGPNSIHSA